MHRPSPSSTLAKGPAPGSPPVVSQPWLHDLAICVGGNGTALSGADGSMGGGAEGFFVDDERVLSTFDLRLGGAPLTGLTHTSRGSVSEFLGSARHLGNPGPDPTVEVSRRRVVDGPTLTETLVVTSRADEVLDVILLVTAGADGADISAVKAGSPPGAVLSVSLDDGSGPTDLASWRSSRLDTTLTATPAPSSKQVGPDGVELCFDLDVPPGGSRSVELTVRSTRLEGSAFPADAVSGREVWAADLEVVADDPRLGRLVSQSLEDLRGLLLSDPDAPADVFAAAGTPWYLTLFGRDSIWAARMMLPVGTELAGGTLRALARRQGTHFDPATAEAPGKIPHELRRTAYTDETSGMSLPPVYYGTIDATALWVCLLHDAWRWGLPEAEVRDLLPALRSAARWLLEVAAPDADGLIRYVDESGHGLVNQGWKDSGDSMRFRDGSVATAPIALVEAQAYAVEAAACAADLLRAVGSDGEGNGDDTLAATLTAWADALRLRVGERFWVGQGAGRYLAMAIDGLGRAVDGVGSNMGHALGTGVLGAADASAVAARLVGPGLLGPFGIRTLAADNGGYNPIGYHTGSVWVHDTAICALGLARSGFDAEAGIVAARLLDAGEEFGYRLPELFSDVGPLGRPAPYPASCRPQAWAAASAMALVSVALGLAVDVPGRTVTVSPPKVAAFGGLRVGGLRVGEATVTVTVSADGAVSVDGLPEGFTLLGR
ncbi:MAG: glycogen debranching N-terminal domain-containing protein [Terracoccus sp.]